MKKDDVIKILDKIGLSPAEARVYLSLLEGDESVQQIMRVTGEKRPTVYYSLNSLEKRGLVSKTGKDYGNKFQVAPLENLKEIVEDDIRSQQDLLANVQNLASYYSGRQSINAVQISHFDNIYAIKSAIYSSLYCKEGVIRTIVPGKNYFHEMGSEFVKKYVEDKVRRGIKTKALWESMPSTGLISKYYPDSEIKQLPKNMHRCFETTVFMFDDKTLYVAPKKDNYAVLVQSLDHAKMMNSVFDNIWSTAKSVSTK